MEDLDPNLRDRLRRLLSRRHSRNARQRGDPPMAIPAGLVDPSSIPGGLREAEGTSFLPQEEEKEEDLDNQEEEKQPEGREERKDEEDEPEPYVYDAGYGLGEQGIPTSKLADVQMGVALTPEEVADYPAMSPRGKHMDKQSKKMAEAEDKLIEVLQDITDPSRLSKRITRQFLMSEGKELPKVPLLAALHPGKLATKQIWGRIYAGDQAPDDVDIDDSPWYQELQDELIETVHRYHDLRNIRQGQIQNKVQRAQEDLAFKRRLERVLPKGYPRLDVFFTELLNQGALLGDMLTHDDNVVFEGRPAMRMLDPDMAAQSGHTDGGDFVAHLPEIPEIRQALVDPVTGQAGTRLPNEQMQVLKKSALRIARETITRRRRVNHAGMTADIAAAMMTGIGAEDLPAPAPTVMYAPDLPRVTPRVRASYEQPIAPVRQPSPPPLPEIDYFADAEPSSKPGASGDGAGK